MSLSRKVKKWASVTEPEGVRPMAVASCRLAVFAWTSATSVPRARDWTWAKAREVPPVRESHVFTPLERDVMEYSEAMTQTRPQCTTNYRPGCGSARSRPR